MFRAGFLQFTPTFGDVEGNLRRIGERLDGAPPADLLVLPELALTGYRFADRAELRALAARRGGRAERALAAMARARGVHLIVGMAERDGERLYNAALAIAPDGRVARYRKVHLFDREKTWFDPGCEGFPVVRVGGARVGLLICFDWAFPEAARTLALRGADVLAHPSNLVLPHGQQVMRARCIENRVFAVTANRCGREGEGADALTFTGGSQVVDPAGERLARGPADADAVEVVELDLARARDKRPTPGNHLLGDRRPELYER